MTIFGNWREILALVENLHLWWTELQLLHRKTEISFASSREKSVQADKQFTNLTKKPINRLQQTTKHKNEQRDKRYMIIIKKKHSWAKNIEGRKQTDKKSKRKTKGKHRNDMKCMVVIYSSATVATSLVADGPVSDVW